jgi:hypothetical protein
VMATMRQTSPGRSHHQARGQRLLELLPQARQYVAEGDAEGAGDMAQLDDVQAAFAGLVLADEGLGDVEFGSDLDLGEAGLLAEVAQQPAEALVLRRVDRLLHAQQRTVDRGNIPKSDIVRGSGQWVRAEGRESREVTAMSGGGGGT